MPDYSSGHTFQVHPGEVREDDPHATQLAPGWYAQWTEDMDSGEITGPFDSEDKAARVFLAP
jgi:hypothetical protein